MRTVYQPTGRAREYAPYALNLYNGCDHNCFYCYVPRIFKRFGHYIHSKVTPKEGLLENLVKYLTKHKVSKQVLLCFTGDPYCRKDTEVQLTREALKILLKYRVPVAILTKGGRRCLRDLDLFKQFGQRIKVGLTLTYTDDNESIKNETGAADYTERKETLKELHENGIRTWVSLEPILDSKDPIIVITETITFVDEYKIGAVSGYEEIKRTIDWQGIANEIVPILRENRIPFYVKKDFRELVKYKFKADETDMDKLTLTCYKEQRRLFT